MAACGAGVEENWQINPFTGEPYENEAEFLMAVHRWRSGAQVKIDPKLVARAAKRRAHAAAAATAESARIARAANPNTEEDGEKPWVLRLHLDWMPLAASCVSSPPRMSERELAESRHGYDLHYELLDKRREEEAREKEWARLAELGKNEVIEAVLASPHPTGPKNRRKRQARKAAKL